MIAVCPNPFRDIGLKLTREAMRILNAAGYDTVVCPVFAEDEPDVIPDDVQTTDLTRVSDRCSMILVIGGDGTLLAVARKLHGIDVPILGVNLGTKGFMATLEPHDLPLIVKAAANEMPVSRRMKMDVDLIRNGSVIYSDCALNDVVIHGYGDCVKLTSSCDGDVMMSFSGDGIILSTPTGSTGYSMSAGGPIVEPDAENIIVTPICAHMMGARSFVLDPSRRVEVKTEKLHTRRAFLSVDGNSVYDMANEDMIVVKRSEQCTRMINMGRRSFYDTAYEKLT